MNPKYIFWLPVVKWHIIELYSYLVVKAIFIYFYFFASFSKKLKPCKIIHVIPMNESNLFIEIYNIS